LGQRYLTSPAKLTMREDVVWWASVLTGRSDITAVDYRILHRDTIKKALAELDALALDFRMEVVEHRRGRKVEELQFRVVPKTQKELSEAGEGARAVFDLQLVERLVMLGFRRPDAQDLYAVTDEGVLRAALDHVEARLRNATLPPVKSAVAYLKDAVRKSYAGSAAQPGPKPPPKPTMEERLERLREEWRQARVVDARRAYEELTEPMREQKLARFEAERLAELPVPIARAWRQDGVRSRIASATFYRWLAGDLWPGEVSDSELLAFALDRDPRA
ncbi:MAG: replication initiation protein, partial [Rhizobacter sp.]|nr:replication initiation protein [Rhizobacter sp.]